MALYPRRVTSTSTQISVVTNDGTTFVTHPNTYKGNQTFGTLQNTASTISSAGGWKYLGEELGAGQPSTKLRDIYKTTSYLDDNVAPSGIYRQGQLTLDSEGQYNVWQSAAWNGYGFWYQAAGGHSTGYINDLLMLRVADPVGVHRIYEPAPPSALLRNNVLPNPSGVGAGCYIDPSWWSQYPTGTAAPMFDWGPHPEHQYMGWMWDSVRELLIVGGDAQTVVTDATYTHGALATRATALHAFNPNALTPRQAWTRYIAPQAYAPFNRNFGGGVQNADGTWAFRAFGQDTQTCKFDSAGGTIVTPSGVAGYPGIGSFASMFRDPATNKYYEIYTGNYNLTTVALWNRTDGVKVCDLPHFPGAAGYNYDDNAPGAVIVNGYMFILGHPSAGNFGAQTIQLAAWRINLATGAIDTFSDGFTISGTGVVKDNLTMNGFHGRIGYISATTPKCFVLQVSPKLNALVFRPPASWGL
jgi:hypothetical protein